MSIPDVEVLRDPLQGVGLRHPVDLRVQEVFIEAERLELLPRVIEGVLARNAVEDAHLVELPDQGDHVLLRAHVVRLEEDPVPERLIEVPDDALDVGLRVLPLSLDPRAGASPVREPHEVGGQEHELRRLVPIGNQRHVEREPGLGDGRQVTVGELMARIAGGERDPRPKGRQGRGACGDLDLGSRDAQHNLKPQGLRGGVVDLEEEGIGLHGRALGATVEPSTHPLVENEAHVAPADITGEDANQPPQPVEHGEGRAERALCDEDPARGEHPRVPTRLELAPLLERDLRAEPAGGGEAPIAEGAVAEPAAALVGALLVQVARLVAGGSGTFRAVLAPDEEARVGDSTFRLEGGGRFQRGAAVEGAIELLKFEHAKPLLALPETLRNLARARQCLEPGAGVESATY